MSNMFSIRTLGLACVGVALIASTPARADEAGARNYLDAARDDVKNGNFDSVERTLELMEEQLEGVDAGVVAKLKAEGEAIKKDAADKKFVSAFDEAEKRLTKLEKDKDLARYTKAMAANPEGQEERLEFENVTRAYAEFENDMLKPLPPEHPRTKAIRARYEKNAAPVMKLALASQKQEMIDKVMRAWDLTKSRTGAVATDTPAPTYEQFMQGTEARPAEQSFILAAEVKEILADENTKSLETAFGDDDAVAKLMKEIHAAYDHSVAKLTADVTQIADGAEKAQPDLNNAARLARLADSIKEVAPAGEAQLALAKRLESVTAKWVKGDSDATAAQAAKIEALEKSAGDVWDAMAAQYEGKTVEVDPGEAVKNIDNFKGKLVRFTGQDNIAGTQYGGPEYAYVTTVNGQPLSFKLTDKAKKAIAAYEAVAGRPMSYGEMRDVVGKVVAVGKVNVLQYDSIREQYLVIGQVDTPVLEIVAFKSRFVSVDETKGSNTDTLK